MDARTPSVPRELAGGANEQSDQAHRLAAVCCAGEMTQFTTFVTRTGNGRSWSRPEVTPSHPGRVSKLHSEEVAPSHPGRVSKLHSEEEGPSYTFGAVPPHFGSNAENFKVLPLCQHM